MNWEGGRGGSRPIGGRLGQKLVGGECGIGCLGRRIVRESGGREGGG